MPGFRLTKAAKADMLGIGRYTRHRWAANKCDGTSAGSTPAFMTSPAAACRPRHFSQLKRRPCN